MFIFLLSFNNTLELGQAFAHAKEKKLCHIYGLIDKNVICKACMGRALQIEEVFFVQADK